MHIIFFLFYTIKLVLCNPSNSKYVLKESYKVSNMEEVISRNSEDNNIQSNPDKTTTRSVLSLKEEKMEGRITGRTKEGKERKRLRDRKRKYGEVIYPQSR